MRKGEVVKQWLSNFPDTPSLTLAKAIYRHNNELFMSVENIRDVIRYYRGKNGKKLTETIKSNEFFQDKPSPHNPFDDLPEGLTYYDEWEPYEIEGERILTLADVHAPYYEKTALLTAVNYGKRKSVDTVLFLGDLIDFFSVSFWEKDPRRRDIQAELDATLYILDGVRTTFPDAKMVLKVGNHDERIERYLKVKAPELLGMNALSYEEQFKANRFDMDVVKDNRLIKIGDLNAIHGHEFRRTFFSPVNPARGLYLRGKETSVCAHFHRTSEHAEKTMTDDVTVCWSIGCLCDLRPRYATFNSWNHGCALIYRDGKKFFVKNRKIIDGQLY